MQTDTIAEIIARQNDWWFNENASAVEVSAVGDFLMLQNHCSQHQFVHLSAHFGSERALLMRQLAFKLVENTHLDPKAILYLDFSDYGLQLKLEQSLKIYQVLVRTDTPPAYLLVNAYERAADWQRTVNHLLREGVHIVLASASKSEQLLQNRQIKELLIRGRLYNDYLQAERTVIDATNFHLAESYFADYLIQFTQGDKERFDRALYRDVIAQQAIRSPDIVEKLCFMLLNNRQEVQSINSYAGELDISPDSAKRYMDALQAANLLFAIEPWRNQNGRNNVIKRYYTSEQAFKSMYCDDLQTLFENYLALSLRDRQLAYIAADGLNFLVINDIILVAPSFQKPLSGSNLKLFERINLEEKYVISSIADLQRFINELL